MGRRGGREKKKEEKFLREEELPITCGVLGPLDTVRLACLSAFSEWLPRHRGGFETL